MKKLLVIASLLLLLCSCGSDNSDDTVIDTDNGQGIIDDRGTGMDDTDNTTSGDEDSMDADDTSLSEEDVTKELDALIQDVIDIAEGDTGSGEDLEDTTSTGVDIVIEDEDIYLEDTVESGSIAE